MSVVSQVKRSINSECKVQQCRKNLCSLNLNDFQSPYLLIDMDHDRAPRGNQGGKKCDYIFIGEAKDVAWVAPLELKGGKFSASGVIEQLQAGAKVADSIVPTGVKTRFRPIVVHGRGIHRAELKRMNKRRIQFREQENLIGKARCGTSLFDALKKD